MKKYPLVSLFLVVGLAGCATKVAPVQSLGANTYAVSREARTGFTRDTSTLKEQALAEARKFCADHSKQLKIVAVTEHRPRFYTESFAAAKVVFKALDADDPELKEPVAPVAAPAAVAAAPGAGDLYSELVKLDDLRKRGILTEDEFQSEKKKVLDRSK